MQTRRAAPRRRDARPWEEHHLRRGAPPHRHGGADVLDGPINRDAVHAYVEQVLVPELNPGDVVIMDNLASHKAPAVREMIEAAGASLLYRPPYSPDFNPIKQAFSSSRLTCAKPPSAPSMASGTPAVAALTSTRLPSGPTFSRTAAMMQIARKPLYCSRA